jgi:hypothetical protein
LFELHSRISHERKRRPLFTTRIGAGLEENRGPYYFKGNNTTCPINEYFETVKVLINGGSDPTTIQVVRDLPLLYPPVETALNFCMHNDDTTIEIMRWMLRQNQYSIDINRSNLFRDVADGVYYNQTRIKMLLRAGVNIHQPYKYGGVLSGLTLLQTAIYGSIYSYNPQENVDAWLSVLEEEGYNLYEYGRKEASLYTIPYRECCLFHRSEVFAVNGPVWYEVHHTCTELKGLSVKVVLSETLQWFGWGAFDLLIFCDLNTPGICESCWYPNSFPNPYTTAEYYCYSCREFDLCRHCYQRYNDSNSWGVNTPRTCRFNVVEGGEHNYVLYDREILLSTATPLAGEELAHQLSEMMQVLTFRLFMTLFSISRWFNITYMTASRILDFQSFQHCTYLLVLAALSFFFAKMSLLMAIVAGKLLCSFVVAAQGVILINRRNR